MARRKQPAERDFRNILVVGSIGIGNLLMFRPALERLRERFPAARVTVLVLKTIFRDVLDADPLVDEVYVADFKSYPGITAKAGLVRDLRSRKFDLAVTAFPANRLEYNLLAFLAGAPVRLGHRYPRKGLRSLSYLQNVRVPVRMGTHDVEQNLQLLAPLGVRQDTVGLAMAFPLTDDDRAAGRAFLAGADSGDALLVGMHPGSSEEHMMSHKRWPTPSFTETARRLVEAGCRVLVFGGPAEEGAIDEVCAVPGTIPVKRMPLRHVAALIGHCTAFVTNDSGLMHVAAAMDVPTVAVFGPTDHVRTAPYGAAHRVVRTGISCSPCWPLKDVGFRARCVHPRRRCVDELPVAAVLEHVLPLVGA